MHEKIISGYNGINYKIQVEISFNFISNKAVYHIRIFHKEKFKKYWHPLKGIPIYIYNRLTPEKQLMYDYFDVIHELTEEVIQAAKMELWEKIKP